MNIKIIGAITAGTVSKLKERYKKWTGNSFDDKDLISFGRKGSGFGKIISGYEFQINYDESKRPLFRSDRYQFTVVMPNLNYDVPQDVPQDVLQDKLDVQIVDLIRKDRKISTEKMAIVLGVSSKTIKRHIKEMDNVCYVGRGFSGHWEITDDE